MSDLAKIIQAATQQWEAPLDITEAESIAHEVEVRGRFIPTRPDGAYPQYPNDRVRYIVEALDSGRLPS